MGSLEQQNLIFEHPELIESICKLFEISKEDLKAKALKEKPFIHLPNGSIYIDSDNSKVVIKYKDVIIINIESDGDNYNLSVFDETYDAFRLANERIFSKWDTSDGWYYIEDVNKCFPGLRYYVKVDWDGPDGACTILDDKLVIVGRGPKYNRRPDAEYCATNPEDAENFEIDYSKYADHEFMVHDSEVSCVGLTYKEYLDFRNHNKE